MLRDPLVLAMLGTGFTFAATAVGAAAVLKKTLPRPPIGPFWGLRPA